MMGIKERSFGPLPDLSLEELVSEENFYRRLQSTLDLSFVRELVRPFYACEGRPSVDPVVFFKLQLVMFFEDLRSERQLMQVVTDRLSLRWYLGYDLREPLPDHSSLTRIRERYGLVVFRCFFERIVEMCFEAGLIQGHELYFDATKVEANASLDSMRSRSLVENRLEEYLAGIFPEQKQPVEGFAQEANASESFEVVGSTDSQREALEKTNTRRHCWIAEAGRQQRDIVRWGYRRLADLRASATDPDASPMHYKKGESRLGYLTHYVVDGGKGRVILDALVTPAEVTENLPMLELLFRARFRWHLRPHSVTGDAAYGTIENVAAVEKAGIRAYMVLPNHDKRSSLFGKNEFIYDAERDLYTCPQGETLRRQGRDHKERSIRYAAKPSACNACLLRSRCTKSKKKGRWLRRSLDEEYLDKVRAYGDTEPYRKALRKRQVWVEPLFAEAKDWHGLRRFRLRRLEKVNAEALLIAAGQNIKRLLAFGSWGPKELAQAAALRPLDPNPYDEFRYVRKHHKRCAWRSARVFQHPVRDSRKPGLRC
jgi:transposase